MPTVFPALQSTNRLVQLAGWRAPASRYAALRQCSLVIPTSGRKSEVERLLNELLALPDAPAEVVVVDADPSHDLGAALLSWRASHTTPFALVYVESAPGEARQRNAAVDISTREYIFFLDPSVLPLAGYFAQTLRIFEQDALGCVGAVAGVAVNEMRGRSGTALRRMAGVLPRLEPLIYHPSGAYMPASSFRPFTCLRRIDIVPGRACAWRRKVFERRRFSPFFDDHGEGMDADFSLRAGQSWTLLCHGEARVRSAGRIARFEGFANGRLQMRNRFFVWRRHTRNPATRHTTRFWMYSAMMAARDIARFLAGPWRPASLLHGLGILAEMPRCASDPPRFSEPPSVRQYTLVCDDRVDRLIAHGE